MQYDPLDGPVEEPANERIDFKRLGTLCIAVLGFIAFSVLGIISASVTRTPEDLVVPIASILLAACLSDTARRRRRDVPGLLGSSCRCGEAAIERGRR